MAKKTKLEPRTTSKYTSFDDESRRARYEQFFKCLSRDQVAKVKQSIKAM
jgi:hypothetical protein